MAYKSQDLRGKGYASKFKSWCLNAQVVPTIVSTRIQMGSGLIFDILNELNIALYEFVPNKAGYYWLSASVAFQTLNIGDETTIRLYRNLIIEFSSIREHTIVGWNPAMVSGLLYLLPTDTVYVEAEHNFGANRTIANGSVVTRFEGFRIG